MTFRSAPFLRTVLFADAALCAVTGIALALGAGPLESLLALPAPLSRWAGIALLPWAAALLAFARSEALPRATIAAVIAGNFAWAAASVLIVAAGWIDPTALGTAFVFAQALVVAGIAEAQWIGLRRSTAVAPA